MTSAFDSLSADEFDQALIANVHPADWKNPTPAGRYNLVVLGGGTAGLVTAMGAAGLGARVALVERGLLGGDCLNVGCVPSKALLRCARAAADTRDAGRFGVRVEGACQVDFPAVMQRVRRIRSQLSPNDSARRFRDAGVDVYFGDAAFGSAGTVAVRGAAGDRSLNCKKAVIATGTRAAVPPIAGLAESGFRTNETIFSLTELPRRLCVLGGGAIGCELAQAFVRFGAEVHQFEQSPRLLPRDDDEAAAIVARNLVCEGVQLKLDSRLIEVRVSSAGKTVVYEHKGARGEIVVDEILVAAGRKPNVEGLNLEAAGVGWDPQAGVLVDDRLRTSNRDVYACGDVCLPYKFTHAADASARIVIQNALFFGRARVSSLHIPWCTYTDPEIAQTGLTVEEAAARSVAIETFREDLGDVDRALLDGQEEGFVKVHVRRGTDTVVGATIVAAHAGEMISELTLAMAGGFGLKQIAKTIHPYPTQVEAIRKIGDQFNRTRLTPRVRRLFQRFLAWRR